MKARVVAGWCAALSLCAAGAASAQDFVDRRFGAAKPGQCVAVNPICLQWGKVPLVRSDCSPVTIPSGHPICQSTASYWCGVGFQPLYRSKTGGLYFLESDAKVLDEKQTFFVLSAPLECRPPRHESCWSGLGGEARTRFVKGWYCRMLNFVRDMFASEVDLIDRLRDNGGLINRFNSFFGGSPNLKSLQKKFATYARTLRAELDGFHRDEIAGRRISTGYYENRLNVLKELRALHDELHGKTTGAVKDIISTAEKASAIAKKVQKVLIKVAGGLVFVFTGSRIAQCLTEAGIETAAEAVTQKLQGNSLSVSGVAKDGLRTLIFKCADALTGGKGSDIVALIVGQFRKILENLAARAKEKIRGFWKSIAGKVKSVVDKLSFLMDDDVVNVLSHSAEEVVVEFGVTAFPGCLAPLAKKDFRELFRCLGRAAKRAVGVGVPRGLFDAAMDALERNIPEAKRKLESLASKLGVENEEPVRAFLVALKTVAKQAVRNARTCREQIQGFSSARVVFQCLAQKLLGMKGVKVAALAPIALWELVAETLRAAEHRVVDQLRRHQASLQSGLAAMGMELPNELVTLLRAGAAAGLRTFAKDVRKCLPAPGSEGGLKDGIRAAVKCAGQAARKALGAASHALVRGALELLAKAGEQGVAALASVVDQAAQQVEGLIDGVKLVPTTVKEAIARSKKGTKDAGAKAFAKEIRTKCMSAPKKNESLREYVRASARCLADAATTVLRAAGAAALNALLSEVAKWTAGLEKEARVSAQKAASSLVRRLQSIGDILGVDLGELPSVAQLKAQLGKAAASLAKGAAGCVRSLHRESLEASRKHERLSSMVRQLRAPLRAFAPCLRRAVGGKAKAPAEKAPAKKGGKAPASKQRSRGK